MKEFKSFYKSIEHRKFNTWCKYTKRLDTYGCGCQHNCKYCYAKSLLSFRGLFGVELPRVANIHKIRNKIRKLPKYDFVKLGGMTDCFQPIESQESVTYNTILLLNQYRISYLIVTKNNMVSSDYYIQIYDKNLAHFQITITTTDDKKCFEYENAPGTSKRIKSIEKLYGLGYDVSVRLSPYLEQNIDFKTLNNIRCNKILVEFLKVNSFIRKSFNIDYSEYTLEYGGYYHLPLKKKIELVNKINGFEQLSVGEYVKDHHLWFRDNVNYNKGDCCNLDRIYEADKQLALFN